MSSWHVRADRPGPLVRPLAVDPTGRNGPTKSQASGRHWRRTSPGLYVPASVDRKLVEQRILEAAGRLPATGVVSGWAALRLHRVGFADGLIDGSVERPVPLVVLPGTRLRPATGIEVHREVFCRDDVVEMGYDLRAMRPERATFDSARWEPDLRRRVAVIDMALAAGAIRSDDFGDYVQSCAGRSGFRTVERALALANSRSMSPKETELRLIWVLDAGLPSPLCNWPVADRNGRFIGRPDLLSEELGVIGEFDGAHHRSRGRHRDDLRRDDAFRSVGLEPFRIVGADLQDRKLVLGRIASAIERARVSTTARGWQVKSRPPPVG